MAQTPSKACCETPPVVSKGYKEKGSFTEIDGLKTYQTGPSSAKTGILFVYDIFGFFPQTLQGADIIAHSGGDHGYQVFMPDFFEGDPADISWYPPDTPEKGEKLGAFFQNQGAPPKSVGRIGKIIKEIEQKNSNIKNWGVIGFCWGGKVVNLSCQSGSPFKAAVSAHPAMVDANDAPGISCPFLMIPTEGEDPADVEKWEKAVKVKHEVVWYKDQVHGFMAARSDLEDEKVAKAYKSAYEKVLTFFHENLS